MTLGKQHNLHGKMFISWDEMPKSPGHAFYDRLQSVLTKAGFDRFVEGPHGPHCLRAAMLLRAAMVGGIMERTTRRRCGFTFLEVLIALAILALAGVGILSMINDAQLTLAQSRRVVEASLLARQQIFELEIDGVTSITDRKDDFEDHPGLAWRARADSATREGFHILRLRIGSEDGEEDYVVVPKAFIDR